MRSQPHRLSPPCIWELQLRADDGARRDHVWRGGYGGVAPSVTVEAAAPSRWTPRGSSSGLLSMQSQGGGATTATLAGSLNATGDVTASNNASTAIRTPATAGTTRPQ
ncbi:MAG: hypothetical protein ACLSTO_01170 [Bilophila wadsworthia]